MCIIRALLVAFSATALGAGEHTSVNFQGYMEGALRSGYRCAAEIAG